MTPPLRYLLLLSAAAGAVAGGVVATALVLRVQAPSPTNAVDKTPEPTSAEVVTPTADDTARRLAELERRVSGLQSLQQLIARARAAGAAEDTPQDETPALAGSNVDVADPVFEAAVADIISRDREQRELARQEQRKQRREQRIEQSIAHLSSALGLQPNQATELTRLLTAHWEKLTLLRDDSADTNPVKRRAEVDAVVKQAEQAISQVLTPEQAARYKSLSKDEKLDIGPRPERRNNEATARTQTPPAP